MNREFDIWIGKSGGLYVVDPYVLFQGSEPGTYERITVREISDTDYRTALERIAAEPPGEDAGYRMGRLARAALAGELDWD